MRRAITVQEDAFRDMGDVQRALKSNITAMVSAYRVHPESHDEVATGTRVPEDIAPATRIAGIQRSVRRCPPGSFHSARYSHDFSRARVPAVRLVRQQQGIDWNWGDRLSGIRLLYRDLMRLRRNWFNNTRGLRGQHINVFHRNDDNKVIAFNRWDQGGDGDDVIVLANFSADGFPSYNVGVPSRGTWYVRLNSDSNGYSSDFRTSKAITPTRTRNLGTALPAARTWVWDRTR